MALDDKAVIENTIELLKIRQAEAPILNKVRRYWRGKQALPVAPRGVPTEIKQIAKMSRVNLCGLVIDVLSQSMYVDGYRTTGAKDESPAWKVWQANGMDAHQAGIHRAAFAYGTAYAKAVPGEDPNVPVIRGRSPRTMTALYGEDQRWPELVLEVLKRGKDTEYRLYDDELIYFLIEQDTGKADHWDPALMSAEPHGGMGKCPIVRYRNLEDLDFDEPCDGDEPSTCGEIEPLFPLQDQEDFTTFGLLVAQHFSAFKQRYIVGWTTDDENEKMKAAASQFMMFGDSDIKLGEFAQTDLRGYLESRGATAELIATISQIPPHNVVGKLINLSAEALAAAEAGNRRKLGERESTFGESHEQLLGLVSPGEVDESAQVRWRDTEARAFAATVDGLGKLVTMLGVPPEMAWESIPGWTQQDVQRAIELKKEMDALGGLQQLLDQQMGPLDQQNQQNPPAKKPPVNANAGG